MSECWVRGWTHVSSWFISPVCLVHSCRPSCTSFLHHNKALHFCKVNFSKQESVRWGQRRHCLGPWEVWVCSWDWNLLFFLFISESWRIFNRVSMQTASCRWRVIWKPQRLSLGWLERPLVAGAVDECGWGVRPAETGCFWELPLNSAWASKTSEKSLPNRTVQANLMATW